MKTIFTTLLFSMITTVFMGQMDGNQKTDLNDLEVPVTVRNSQEVYFPDTFVTQWYSYSDLPESATNDLYYISNFEDQGRKNLKAYFDPEGNVIAKMTFRPTYTLPATILNNVMETYTDSKIKSGDLIELYDQDMTLYRIRLNTKGLLQYVYYDKYAQMLNPDRLPLEIYTLN